jgi:hypothetical protein
MTTIQIAYVASYEIEDGVFIVEAKASNGRWFLHEGPKGYAYFTSEQAERLASRIHAAGKIDAQYWIDGAGGYHGTAAHEYALLEAEYYEG